MEEFEKFSNGLPATLFRESCQTALCCGHVKIDRGERQGSKG